MFSLLVHLQLYELPPAGQRPAPPVCGAAEGRAVRRRDDALRRTRGVRSGQTADLHF